MDAPVVSRTWPAVVTGLITYSSMKLRHTTRWRFSQARGLQRRSIDVEDFTPGVTLALNDCDIS